MAFFDKISKTVYTDAIQNIGLIKLGQQLTKQIEKFSNFYWKFIKKIVGLALS